MKKLVLAFSHLFLVPFFLFGQSNFEPIIETQKILSERVFFDFGKFEIRTDADSTLQQILIFCQDKNDLQIKITAHTDAVGTNQNNQVLSLNRAKSVKKYLLENGLQIDTLETAVFGEENPVAENNSEIGRQKNRRATIDIFTIKKMVILEGTIVDKENDKPIDAEVIIRTKELQDTTRTDSLGKFKSKVPLGAVAGVDVYAKGYFFETQMMKVLPNKMSPIEMKLAPVRAGEKVDLKNLYFVGNQAVLLPKSKPELPKILKFMEINYCAKIEISGHVNVPNRPDVSKSSWEYLLSKRRAKLVYDYLLANGISEKRISFKGYGNWEMRFPKARSLDHQAMNRRVEIRILETGMIIDEKVIDNK